MPERSFASGPPDRATEDTRILQRLYVVGTPGVKLHTGGCRTGVSSRVAENTLEAIVGSSSTLEAIVGSSSAGMMVTFSSGGCDPKPHALRLHIFLPLEGWIVRKPPEAQMSTRGFIFDHS